MPTEQTIRAYLLGLADPETEKTFEEGILDGSIGTDDLLVLEEELIDDHVFGRLTGEQDTAFKANFLINQERRDRLQFSQAMQRYAQERAPGLRDRQGFSFFAFPRLTLALGLFASCLVAISLIWLGIRNAHLSQELVAVSRTSDERQRMLNALNEEQQRRASQIENTLRASTGTSSEVTVPAYPVPVPSIKLRPGVKRGLEALPVLHLAGRDQAVRITLELAFKPDDGLREDLLRTGGERLWTQELISAAPTVTDGTTTLYVPAELLSPGDYQIHLKDLSADPSDVGDTYAFRVSR